jgi:hypothetical protein
MKKRRLSLAKETIRPLTAEVLPNVHGGTAGASQCCLVGGTTTAQHGTASIVPGMCGFGTTNCVINSFACGSFDSLGCGGGGGG